MLAIQRSNMYIFNIFWLGSGLLPNCHEPMAQIHFYGLYNSFSRSILWYIPWYSEFHFLLISIVHLMSETLHLFMHHVHFKSTTYLLCILQALNWNDINKHVILSENVSQTCNNTSYSCFMFLYRHVCLSIPYNVCLSIFYHRLL